MHPDRKIGFAMGILLIGIVGALFFRNEPLSMDDVPRVRREQELNNHLRERDIAVYVNEPGSTRESSSSESSLPWTLPDLVKDLDTRNSGVPLPVGMQPEVDTPGGPAATPGSTAAAPPNSEIREFPPLFSAVPESAGDDTVKTQVTPAPTTGEATKPPLPAIPVEYEEYVVRYGDTLSGIAEKFLGSQAKYQQIYEANKDRMQAPDRLQVGMSLRIPRPVQNGSLQ